MATYWALLSLPIGSGVYDRQKMTLLLTKNCFLPFRPRNSSEMAETAIETGGKRSSVFEPDLRTIQAILARLAQLSSHFSQSFRAIL